MDNIFKISIVCSTGAEVYEIGRRSNGKFVSEIQRIPGYEDTTGMVTPGKFLVKDDDGNNIAEISDIVRMLLILRKKRDEYETYSIINNLGNISCHDDIVRK